MTWSPRPLPPTMPPTPPPYPNHPPLSILEIGGVIIGPRRNQVSPTLPPILGHILRCLAFSENFFKQILTCLRTLHTNLTIFYILSLYLVACDFVKTESILKLCLILNLSKIQFRQCELWGRPPPLLKKVHILNFFFGRLPLSRSQTSPDKSSCQDAFGKSLTTVSKFFSYYGHCNL